MVVECTLVHRSGNIAVLTYEDYQIIIDALETESSVNTATEQHTGELIRILRCVRGDEVR